MSSNKLECVIGLEVHVQMKTATKLFCGCINNADEPEPNTNVCPICMGHPGTLPQLNAQAVEWGVRTALALGCNIPEQSKFDRKNYFYPDLPKGYQISQYDEPVGGEGKLTIAVNSERKTIRLERLHLEEDAGKLLHRGSASLVDFNRAGTPLMEIVSKPDLRSPEEARAYLQELRRIMRYLGVSDADMEKGHLRADGNISLRPVGEEKLYPKVEVKNVNSFRNMERALLYEIERQTAMWSEGKTPQQETRGFNPDTGETVSQRTKEEAADYRYFPEPDIPPLVFSQEFLQHQRAALPELPDPKRKRFIEEFGISESFAVILTEDREIAEFFENTRSECLSWLEANQQVAEVSDTEKNAITKLCVNWITTELFRLLGKHGKSLSELRITPENMAEFIAMVFEKKINSSAAQTVLEEMVKATDFEPDPSVIVNEKNLAQVSDEGAIASLVENVLVEHPAVVDQIKAGKENGIQFLVGQVMKASKGKAHPEIVQRMIRERL